jgi:hypothetical protein
MTGHLQQSAVSCRLSFSTGVNYTLIQSQHAVNILFLMIVMFFKAPFATFVGEKSPVRVPREMIAKVDQAGGMKISIRK